MFGRKNANTLSPPHPDVCGPQDTCELQTLDDFELIESLDDKASEQLDVLADLASTWDVVAANVSTYIGDRRKSLALGNVAAGESRSSRRLHGRDNEATLALDVADAHNRAARDLESSVEPGIWRGNLPKEGAPSALLIKAQGLKFVVKHNKEIKERSDDRAFLYNGILASFQHAYLARAYMQLINEQNPEALQDAFDPATLKELPSSLQRLALLDLAHGHEGSVLIDNAKKVTTLGQSRSERLAEYINGNHLPEGVRKTLLSINMGMQVMGSPKCPFNDLGICTHQLARIPDDQLPEELRRDMAARSNSAVQKRLTGLQTFSHANSVSRVLDDTVEFNEHSGQRAGQQRKRSPRSVTLERRDMVMAEAIETAPSFQRVVIRSVNGDEDFILNDLNDTEALAGILGQLLEEKPVKKYMEIYRTDKLDDVFGAAFTAIMTLPHYRNTNNTISQWANRKQKPYINQEGVPETYRRYSASRASGTSGGQVGRRTRIIFSEGIKNGTRYITIHRVMRRDDRTANLKLK